MRGRAIYGESERDGLTILKFILAPGGHVRTLGLARVCPATVWPGRAGCGRKLRPQAWRGERDGARAGPRDYRGRKREKKKTSELRLLSTRHATMILFYLVSSRRNWIFRSLRDLSVLIGICRWRYIHVNDQRPQLVQLFSVLDTLRMFMVTLKDS